METTRGGTGTPRPLPGPAALWLPLHRRAWRIGGGILCSPPPSEPSWKKPYGHRAASQLLQAAAGGFPPASAQAAPQQAQSGCPICVLAPGLAEAGTEMMLRMCFGCCLPATFCPLASSLIYKLISPSRKSLFK